MLGVRKCLQNAKRVHLGLYCRHWRVWSEGMSESSCVQVPGPSGGSVQTLTRPPAACLSVPHGAPPEINTCHHLAAKKRNNHYELPYYPESCTWQTQFNLSIKRYIRKSVLQLYVSYMTVNHFYNKFFKVAQPVTGK